MPRRARENSETQVYHVMLRGNAQRQIFQDDEDNEEFIRLLNECKSISKFKLYGYCLMGNHVHLLIHAQEEPLGQIFRRLGARYVYWYNRKYNRIGHLFQDRYKSEIVGNDAYVLAVLRYIHLNPVKAGLVDHAKDYPWSSYHEYENPIIDPLTDTPFVLSMLKLSQFDAFHQLQDTAAYLDMKPVRPSVSDSQAKKYIQDLTHCSTIEAFQGLSKAQRDTALRQLKANHVSLRQISRLTGESLGSVQRA